jgi:putative YhbY family RNA-binding protein
MTGLSTQAWVTDNHVMAQILLTPAQRKDHRAEAHHLNAVVMIGSGGLTAAVQKEIDAALNAHGLIKVRAQMDDRVAREAIFQQLSNELNAAPIQHIGKLLVLWRPMPAKEKKVSEDRMAGPREVKVLKNSSRYGQRPEVKVLRVLGNQRLTPGGTVKRAKKPQLKSLKKRSQD